ncbi:HAD family phosphatase [Oxynema sp. CENA135]|uniref:HAD family hydrolase n=1 Tax=Oxynema sp. CENA135 TaxID=984206 RepID=UPI00190996BC|nr:HAD family phosphatase [Oxynema sp. CENA135]MBK4732264.1 HAD family phosphatase [Oxynema sp. CENA135]
MTIAAILFDLDGTLANTDPIHFLTWQELLRTYDLEIDREFYQKQMSGRLNPAIVADLLPHLSPEQAARVADEKEAQFRQFATQLQPLSGLTELLAWASDRALKCAVVTNAPRENVRFMLDILHLSDRFAPVTIAEDLPAGKPDPLPYQQTLQQLGLSPQEAIAFEDSPSGIRSATAAGIYTIGVASTHDPETLRAIGASQVIADFTAPQLWDDLEAIAPDPREKTRSVSPGESRSVS